MDLDHIPHPFAHDNISSLWVLVCDAHCAFVKRGIEVSETAIIYLSSLASNLNEQPLFYFMTISHILWYFRCRNSHTHCGQAIKKKNQCVTIFCGVVWEVFEISTVSFSRPARVRSWMNRDDASAIWMIKNAGMSENLDIRYRYTNAKRYSLGSNMYRPTSFFSFCLWKQFPIDPYTTIFYFWWTSPDRADRRQRISYYEGIKEIPSVQYTWKRIALLW